MSGKRAAEGSVERDDVEDAAAASTTAKRTDVLADIVPDLHVILKSNEGSYLIKILVPLSCCARMIGPKGATMQAMMQTTGCKIRLSSIEALYPHTQDRVLSIEGSPEKLAQAIFDVLSNLLHDGETGASSSSSSTAASPYLSSLLSSGTAAAAPTAQQKFKFVVRALFPASAAGSVIGRGGTVIQRLSEESGCRIKFEGVDQSCLSSTKERIMFVHGDEVGAMVSAVQLALAQMLTNPTVCVYENQGVNYAALPSFRAGPMGMAGAGGGWAGMGDPMGIGRGGAGALGGGNGRGDNGGGQAYLASAYPAHAAQQPHLAMANNPYAMHLPAAFTTEPAMMEMGVDDDKIGCVLGAQGRTIKEIMALSGTQITVSQRTDYVPGTKNRRLTIIGPPANIQMACSMIQHKLSISGSSFVGNAAKPE